MKRILVFILFLQIGVFDGVSQNDNDYVKVDQSKVDAVIKSIIKENAGASPENKAWAEQLLKNAFGSYFSGNVAKVDELLTIKPIDEIIKMNENKISELEKTNTSLNSRISVLEKNNNSFEAEKSTLEKDKIFLNGRISQLESEKTSLNGRISDLEKDKIFLNGRISQLESEKTSLNGEISKLKKDKISLNGRISQLESGYHTLVRIKDSIYSRNIKLNDECKALESRLKDYEKLGNQKDSLEQIIRDLCVKYDSIGDVDISDIKKEMETYNSFIIFYSYGSEKDYVQQEIKEKLEYLDVVVEAEDFYQQAIGSMSEKYDEGKNRELREKYEKSISKFDNKLKDNQKDKLRSVYDALCGLPGAMDHFRKRLFNYLNDLKVMPDRQVDYNKDLLKKRVVEYCGKEQYNEYYIYLNKVLNEKILGKLRSMTKEDDYQNFLKDIEKSL